jgi:ATP-grasp domain
MGSKGIFVIRNDEDEKRFESILAETGNPTFVVTEYIDTVRSLSCHFFIHPNSNEITWFGSNENRQTTKGAFSHDTIIVMNEQDKLRQMQMQIVKDVVKYFQARDFWGFCGIDVLFDRNGVGYLVDVNPRVTGSSPAIMVAHRLYDKYGFENCIFRRGCRYSFAGSSKQLMNDVSEFNRVHENEMLILVTGFVEMDPFNTLVQLAVYGRKGLDECEAVLNSFAPLMKNKATVTNTTPTMAATTTTTIQARNKQ